MHRFKVINDGEEEFLQASTITKKYDIGRTTAWKYLKEMRTQRKYQHSFIDLSYKLKLVKKADFEEFLYSQHNKYLTK